MPIERIALFILLCLNVLIIILLNLREVIKRTEDLVIQWQSFKDCCFRREKNKIETKECKISKESTGKNISRLKSRLRTTKIKSSATRKSRFKTSTSQSLNPYDEKRIR